MLFHTWPFVFFFVALFTGYYILFNTRFRVAFLVAGSYFFYGCFSPEFVLILLATTVIDYFAGRGVARGKHPKAFLVFSLVMNLGILCSFKYMGFVTENVAEVLRLLHIDWEFPEIKWLLPVGVSFFTFKSMSYTIELYRKTIRVETNFIRYAAYVSFFPQLVAGPIERAATLLPQLRHRPLLRREDFSEGAVMFITGLFKKAVMADMLTVFVDHVYDAPADNGAWTLLFATYAFAWQIYFDFSGYSDMARGIARMLGLRIMLNFNNPYVAVDVRDFWRRWHISLSTWFRDYVYIPMGGNRGIKLRIWWNVLVTMLVSGLWHGAAWTFVIWGGLNGLGSIASMLIDRSAWFKAIPKLIRQLLVFNFISLTWIFFRAPSLDDALTVLKRIVSGAPGSIDFPLIPALLVGLIWIYQLIFDGAFGKLLGSRICRIGTVVIMLLVYFFLGSGANVQFIYAQF